jgi:lysyl-tRNA synthetase class 1
VEPFGKDHASRGGSYDTGKRFASEVFGIEAPFPMVYEWISLAGKGDMSASKGNVLSVAEMLEVVPPEILRYLVLKARPTRTVTFDPGRPLGQLLDEVDDASARGRDDRALELSRAAGFKPVGVPFHHIVLVAQLAEYDIARVLEMLHEGHYEGLDPEAVEARVKLARGWLERFAPEDQRVEVTETLAEGVAALSDGQKAYLGELAEKLPGLSDAGEIHELVYGLAKAEGGPGPKPGFQAIYQALLGRDRGPKAATFIAALGAERVAKRLAEASRA